MLKLTLFGSFRSSHHTQDIQFRTNKIRALIAYLAVESGADGVAHPRDRLATLLWSESDDKTARQNLRINLSRMRQAVDKAAGSKISDQLFEITNQTIRFKPAALDSVSCDVTRFRQLISTCETHDHEDIHYCNTCLKRLKEAADLYQGDLLAGIQMDDTYVFEEWLILHRERLLQQAQLAFDIIVESYQVQGRHELVREYGSRLLALEPWRESTHRHLMLALANSGQRTAALAQFARCKQILWDELGAEPSPETVALAQKIESGDLAVEEHEVTRVVGSAGTRTASPHNLPAQTTSYYGRDHDIQKIIRLVDDPHRRLVTLVGEGGIGKSRLSLEVGRRLSNSFKDGIWFVPLTVLATTGDQAQLEKDIATLVCETIGLSLSSNTPTVELLLAHVKTRHYFLIFDNFEHVLDGAGLLVKLLEAAPDLMILASSREPLGFMAEMICRVLPLQLPPQVGNADSQAHNPAVALFVDRAQRATGDFELEDGEQEAQTAELVRLLGGVPLALELVAAGLRQQSLPDLLHSVQRSFDQVAMRFRDVPKRHQSMRAVFENSWILLSPEEQRVFAMCAVFRGGFWPAAAETVTGGPVVLLNILAEKSLLQRDESGRYGLHELVRQFGDEKRLEFTGIGVHDRHSHYYLGFVVQQAQALIGPRPQDPAAEITLDLDNIRAAWQTAVDRLDANLLLPAIEPLSTFYELRGYYREAAERFATTVELFEKERGSADETVLTLRTHQIRALVRMSEYDSALELIDQYLVKTKEYIAIEGSMNLSWGEVLWRTEKYDEATKLLDVVREDAKNLDLLEIVASTQYHLGIVSYHQSQPDDAIKLLGKAAKHWEKTNNLKRLAQSLNNQGVVYLNEKEYTKATDVLEKAYFLNEKIGDAQAIINILNNLSLISIEQNQFEKSAGYLDEVLRFAQNYGDQIAIAIAYQNLGWNRIAAKDKRQALYFLDQCMVRFKELNNIAGQAKSLLLLGRAHLIDDVFETSLNYFASALKSRQGLQKNQTDRELEILVKSTLKKFGVKSISKSILEDYPDWIIFQDLCPEVFATH